MNQLLNLANIKKLLAGSALLLLCLVALSSGSASALSGSDYKAGRIIDDAVFFNSNSMTSTQIQQFLEAKVPVCDTNGEKPYASTTRADYGTSRGYPPPYTCLKDYRQNVTARNPEDALCNGMTAASNLRASEIIYRVAQSCGVSPKVLIILLQKEQSLVTDDWPWSIQYRSATGYGCPDSGPNYSANCDSSYYGFYNQVYMAARVYKYYAKYPNSFNHIAGRNNYILYNPNPDCGGTSVFIENQATAGLYNYTPYQPNTAALNNLYGTGDSCSAYGNRNFWRMFHDWFGSTTGSLIRTPASATLYYTDGERRHTIPSMSIAAEFGLGLRDVRYVSQGEMDSIPLAQSPYSLRLGTLVKSESDSDADGSTVYFISNGLRYAIPSMTTFNGFGFDSSDITYLSLRAVNRLQPSSKALSNLVKGSGSTIYQIESGKKRTIFELSKLTELNTSNNISKFSDFGISRFGYGVPQVDGDYVIAKGASIRIYNSGNYFDVNSLGAYLCWKLQDIKTFKVSDFNISNGTKQGNLQCNAEDSSGIAYTLSGSNKLQLPTGHGLATSRTSQTLMDRFTTKPITKVLRGSSSTLSAYENGIRRNIPNMQVFGDLGYTGADISTITSNVFSSIPQGPYKLSPGVLMTTSDSKSIYVVSSEGQKLSIPSASFIDDFAYSWSSVLTVPATTVNAYATASNLPRIGKTGSEAYIIDSGSKFIIDPSIDSHIGIDRATLTELDAKLVRNTDIKNMTRFTKSNFSSTIYYLENGQKRPISSWSTFIALGGEGKVTKLSQRFLNTIQTGSNI